MLVILRGQGRGQARRKITFMRYGRDLVKLSAVPFYRYRSIMKPQTKRSLCLGSFLVIVTLVVLYSYCNGNSVCYTFPFLSGLDRDRLGTKPQAEVLVASVIVQAKRPLEMRTPMETQKGILPFIQHPHLQLLKILNLKSFEGSVINSGLI